MSRAPTTPVEPAAPSGAAAARSSRSLRRRVELAARPDARLWSILIIVAVVVGCLLRVLRWIDNPGLWLDESFLSINLINKPFEDIFGPLQFLQSAPPGFLLAEKGAEVLIGDADRWLRLFPLLASLGSVLLFAYSARRVLAAPAAALAVALFATAEPLLLRSAEVKHYSTDLAMTTLLVALYLWTVDAPAGRRTRRALLLGVVAPLTLWLSFPAVFTVAALVAALVVHAWDTRSREVLTGAATGAVLSLVSFGVVYTIASSNVSSVSSSLFGGADEGFSAVGRLKTIENAWWLFKEPGGFDNETNSLAAMLALLGVIALARRGTLGRLTLFGLPLLLAAAADLLDRYPLGGRFSVFLVPLLVLLVARGAQWLVAWSRQPLVVGAIVGLFLVASPVAIAGYHAVENPARSDVKPILSHLVREWQEGDSLYVYPDAQYQLRYYSQCKSCSVSGKDFPWPIRLAPPGPPGEQYAPALESAPPSVVIGSREDPDVPLGALEDLPQKGRIWLFFSTTPLSHDGLDDENLIVRTLTQDGSTLKTFHARGARLYLIDRAGR